MKKLIKKLEKNKVEISCRSNNCELAYIAPTFGDKSEVYVKDKAIYINYLIWLSAKVERYKHQPLHELVGRKNHASNGEADHAVAGKELFHIHAAAS